MAGGSLRLYFRDYGDGTCDLKAQAEADGFAGASGACFSVAELEAFAAALTTFPLPSNPRPEIAAGFYEEAAPHGLRQEHLALAAYQVGRRGYVGVQVRMMTPLWGEERPESQKAVRLEIITTYEPLARFARELLALVQGSTDEAVLEGDAPE
jgi:hypothetical protein